MTESKNKSGQGSSDSESHGSLGGERLAEARRAQKVSVRDIAKELHLDEPKVRALERNEFDVLGAPVFAKGHLRKYAQLVGVSADDVMADYYQLNRAAGVPQVVSARPRPRREMSPGPWIAVIVIVVLVATAYWWFTSPRARVDDLQGELPPQEVNQALDAAVIEPGIDDSGVLEARVADVEADEPGAPQAASTDSAVVAPATAADGEAIASADQDDGQLRLLVTYSGDCWTEITDAVGRRLFFGLGTDGRTVELSGAAPFNVLFGNAENVSLRVNGAERPISAAERRGPVARLTLSGS